MRTGRPKIAIDKEQFTKLCSMFCTEEEIAGFFDCSVDTIERFCKREFNTTFAEAYKKGSALGKMSLRRTQFEWAKKSPAMAMFLGKNYLGQSDNPVTDIDEATKKMLDKAEQILGEVDSVIK